MEKFSDSWLTALLFLCVFEWHHYLVTVHQLNVISVW